LALGPCRALWPDTSSTHRVSLCTGGSCDLDRATDVNDTGAVTAPAA
jgi:hypothetical protein